MCLFSSSKEPYVRNYNDPPPHRSYYSAHPDGVNAVQVPDLVLESRRRSHSRRRRSGPVLIEERPRRSREVIEYDRREIEYASAPHRRELEYYPTRPRSSAGSVGLPRGFVREIRPPGH